MGSEETSGVEREKWRKSEKERVGIAREKHDNVSMAAQL